MLTVKKIIGNFGEELANNFLKSRGYAVIARNKKFRRWEFDLIAEKSGQIIFVEVKTLCSAINPAETCLSRRQIELLHRAMFFYCWKNKIDPLKARLDFISVNIDRAKKTARLRHYKNIF
ncbi:MAG TPA: YraN family protein [Candidatus Nanoarchaeia archaeon]|nr:YraN family protein [Candidatus Nanoarchaeia archaeon]